MNQRHNSNADWAPPHGITRPTHHEITAAERIAANSAIDGFTPVSVCTTPGQLGSSEMCKSCTATCAGPDMAADIDPAELELIRSGAIS